MKSLSPDWFAEGTIDFELKQYLLQAWLSEVKKQFSQTLLYPSLSELVFHHNHLSKFKESKDNLQGKFPQVLKGMDTENFRLHYESPEEKDIVLQEIGEIVEYALPHIRTKIEEGKEIYEFIETKIDIDPVGVLPLYKNAGYFLLRSGAAKQIKAFEYQISVVYDAGENFRQIQTELVWEFDFSISNTFESIKLDLIRRNPKLPNPATFAVHSELEFPEKESLLPVVKRKFFRFLLQKFGSGPLPAAG